MFENKNKAATVEIARGTMKAHRLRNVMACLAVILTTVLIMVVCGVGIGTINAMITESGVKPGPGADGMGIYGDRETLDRIREQPDVEWADIARPCMQGTPKNKEFAGNTVKFLAVDHTYYKHHYVDLLTGQYPKNDKEILMSDTLARKTGREMIPGQKIELNLIVIHNNKQEQRSFEFTICGFYDNPLQRMVDYEELYTVETFPDLHNPELKDRTTIIYVRLVNGIQDTSEKMDEINETVQGEGVLMKMDMDFDEEIANTVFLLILVILCGFLLIYNIFRISVVNDIHFVGNMKTIGMTKKQIRQMMAWQIRRLGAIGIMTGSVLGTGFNFFCIRLFQDMGYSYSRYYEMGEALTAGFAAGILFAAATVWISSRVAVSLAGKISPVAASRYRTSGRKKKFIAAASYTLGSMLFCVLFTVFAGYDTDWAVDRMNESDFTIQQWHAVQVLNEPYEPMTEQFVRRIQNLDFVKESFLFYRARNAKCDIPQDHSLYNENYGEVKWDGHYKEVMEKELQKAGPMRVEEFLDSYGERDRVETGIVGMESAALAMEAQNVDVLDGALDADLFATGDYLIYQPYFIPENISAKDYLGYGMRAGDKIMLSIWNSDKQEYYKKSFKVLAVVKTKEDSYAGEINPVIQFTLPNKIFRNAYGESAKNMISTLRINTSGRNSRMEQETIEQLLVDNFNTQIKVESRYKSRKEQQSNKDQKVMLATVLGGCFALIGLVNIMNTVVTGVLSRKLEYAAMQSIGMTRKQMAWGICRDGVKLIMVALVPVCVLGFLAAQKLSGLLATKFVVSVFMLSCLAILLAGIGVAVTSGLVLTRSLNRRTVVERLREVE